MAAPKQTSDAVIGVLHQAIAEALSDTTVVERFAALEVPKSATSSDANFGIKGTLKLARRRPAGLRRQMDDEAR
jgi:imidazoleglycerol phosphate dehydratase HisB